MRLALAAALLLASSAARAADAVPLPEWHARLMPPGSHWKSVPQDFVFNNDTEPQTLDPAIMTGVTESRIALALYEGLTSYDPVTLAPRPGIAERWDVSSDSSTFTFHLRGGLVFTDGERITAQLVRDSWIHTLTPASGAQYAYQLFNIAGAEDFYTGKTRDPATLGVHALDERTLEVRLSRPCPYFLDLCAFPTLMPLPLAAIERWGNDWTKPEHFAGDGPFTLSDWRPHVAIVMRRNSSYWDAAHVMLDSITVRPYDDVETAFKLYQDDQLDWLPSVPPSKMQEVLRMADYYVSPYLGTYYYRFNCSRPPFDDARVRRAFSIAVDRRVITEHVLRAGQLPASWFCPDCNGYHHVEGLAYDPAAARSLLAEAGYGPGGKPFPALKLLTNDSQTHKRVAESVIQQWKEVLGVQVTIQICEWKAYLDSMEHLNYQLARASWIGDYGDPNTFFDLWVTGGGNNLTGWGDPRYDAWLRESQESADPAVRLDRFAKLEALLVREQLPIMPLYMYVNQGLLRERVNGWHENVRDIHPFQFIWLE